MSRRILAGLATALLLLPAIGQADPPSKDVNVVNTPTVTIANIPGVSVLNLDPIPVSVANPFLSVSALQGGPWIVSVPEGVRVTNTPSVSLAGTPAVTISGTPTVAIDPSTSLTVNTVVPARRVVGRLYIHDLSDAFIPVYGYGWGATNTGSLGGGGGGGAGRVTIADLSILKAVDASTPDLFLATARGTPLRDAVLDISAGPLPAGCITKGPGTPAPGDTSPACPLALSLLLDRDVLVTGLAQSIAAGGGDQVLETLTVIFGRIKVRSWDAQGHPVEVTWDVAASR
jgi:type VI secretion system secreted protein Hcp